MKAVGSSKTTVNNYQTLSFEAVAAVHLRPHFFWDVALNHWVSALSRNIRHWSLSDAVPHPDKMETSTTRFYGTTF
jgi:hypothetical protein